MIIMTVEVDIAKSSGRHDEDHDLVIGKGSTREVLFEDKHFSSYASETNKLPLSVTDVLGHLFDQMLCMYSRNTCACQ